MIFLTLKEEKVKMGNTSGCNGLNKKNKQCGRYGVYVDETEGYTYCFYHFHKGKKYIDWEERIKTWKKE
jgi:hypothetical protein